MPGAGLRGSRDTECIDPGPESAARGHEGATVAQLIVGVAEAYGVVYVVTGVVGPLMCARVAIWLGGKGVDCGGYPRS